MEPTLESLRPPGETHNISLSRLAGKPVKDVYGHISCEFGEPVFKISTIQFEDGGIWVDGEHDLPYLAEVPGVSVDTLQRLYDEENK